MFKLFEENNKIYHMASMARSGETLMLKILAVHPDIKIVHNLEKEDDVNKLKAFQFLKTYKKKAISKNHPVIKPYLLEKKQILLLKQGVWKHPYPFKGFVLSRNPVSIYASLKSYDEDLEGYDKTDNFWTGNEERLLRWLKDIDKESIPLLYGKTPVEQFCLFYNIRMRQLLETNLPVIRYEDLLLNTKETIEKVCIILNVKMENQLLNAHNYYENDFEGHGKNDLSKPIDTTSLTKYKQNVTEEEFDFITNNTYETHTLFGYKLYGFNVEV